MNSTVFILFLSCCLLFNIVSSAAINEKVKQILKVLHSLHLKETNIFNHVD